MADATVTPVKPANAAAPHGSRGDHKPNKLLTIGAIILGLAAVQVVTTYVLMSATAESTTDSKHEQKDHSATGRHDSEHDEAKSEFTEVAVGDFSFSNTAAMRNVITHVNFKLTALARSAEASMVESQIDWNQERIREAVNKIVRNSNLDELYDPSLEAIKRLICQDINGLLGKKLIVEVMINDIRVIQQ